MGVPGKPLKGGYRDAVAGLQRGLQFTYPEIGLHLRCLQSARRSRKKEIAQHAAMA